MFKYSVPAAGAAVFVSCSALTIQMGAVEKDFTQVADCDAQRVAIVKVFSTDTAFISCGLKSESNFLLAYTFENPALLAAFLKTEAKLVSVMEGALPALFSIFGDVPLFVNEIHDPEDGERSICVSIGHTGPDSFEKLMQFDEDWGIPNFEQIAGKVSFSLA